MPRPNILWIMTDQHHADCLGCHGSLVRTPTHRLVYYDHRQGGELYDCVADPGEVDNLWRDPAQREVRLELLERLFDRVNQYRAPSEFADDRRLVHEERWMPTVLLHKRRKDWQELHDGWETPSEAKGPWPG
jgi:hypothetical protein